jgi:hypothetical protein
MTQVGDGSLAWVGCVPTWDLSGTWEILLGMGSSEPPRRTLVARAIADIQGSIHANDSKSAAGLVVQGLLATAAVTVASRLGSTYSAGTEAAQILIKVGLGGTLVFAAGSVFFLIKAVAPYDPKEVADRIEHHANQVFFPKIEKLSRGAKPGDDEFDRFWPKYEELKDEEPESEEPVENEPVENEYVVELLKVADIRWAEARNARRGFLLLGVEVGFVVLYLATVGCIGSNILGARAAPPDQPPPAVLPTLRWLVAEGHDRISLHNSGEVALPRLHGVRVGLVVNSAADVTGVRLSDRSAYRCATRSRHRRVVEGSTKAIRTRGASNLTVAVTPTLAPRHCSKQGTAPTLSTVRLDAIVSVRGGRAKKSTLSLVQGV